MNTRVFSYRWSIKILKWFYISGGILFLINAIGLIKSGFEIANANNGGFYNTFVIAMIILLVGLCFLFFCTLGFDFFNEIEIDKNGVTIKYLLKKIQIPWEDIILIEDRKTPWLSKKKDKFVLTKQKYFRNYLRSIFLHGSLKQGFVIRSILIDFDSLSTTINHHTENNKLSKKREHLG